MMLGLDLFVMLFAVGVLLLPLGPGARPRRAAPRRRRVTRLSRVAELAARSASMPARSAEPVVAAHLAPRGRAAPRPGLSGAERRRPASGRPSSSRADHRQVGGGRVLGLAGADVLGTHAHADLHRGAPGGVHAGRSVTSWPAWIGVQERSSGPSAAVTTRMPEWRTAAMPAASSQMLHDHAAVHVARGVRVARCPSSGSGPSARLTEGGAPRGASVRRSYRTSSVKEGGMPGLAGRMSTVIKAKISKAARPGRGPGRDARLRLPEAGRAAPERQEGHRRRRRRRRSAFRCSRRSSSSRSSSSTPRPARRSSQGREDLARAALERKTVAQTELQSLDQQVQELAEPAGAAHREREEAAHQDRGLPHQEGGHQGAVLRRRGAGEDLRGRQRRGRGDGRPRARDPARRGQDRADARPRVAPSRSSRRPGTFDDLTQLGGGQDDIDRELAQLGAGAQVDDELAKMKAELGSGGGERPGARAGRERSPPMIVRISGRGSSACPTTDAGRLNELDNRAVSRRRAGRRDRLPRAVGADARARARPTARRSTTTSWSSPT